MPPIPADLVTALRNRTVVPFVGAGLSLTLGRPVFPDWKALIERFAARLEKEAMAPQAAEVRRLAANSELVAAAEYALQYLPKPRYIEELRAAFFKTRPQQIDLSAIGAVWRMQPRVVITTNFESALEWPFEVPSAWPYQPPSARPLLAYNDDESLLREIAAGIPAEAPLIWHLHGSILRPDTIVLTTSDFERLYGPEKGAGGPEARNEYALRVLTDLIATHPMLFVGFSLGDPFLLKQLRRMLALTKRNSPVSYLLVHKGEKNADALLKDFQIQLVEFEDFGQPMLARLNELVVEANPGAEHLDVANVAAELIPLVADLETRLTGLVPEPEVTAPAYNACRPTGWPPFPPAGDGAMLLRTAVARLAAAPRQGSGAYPLLSFVATIAAQSTSHAAILDAWVSGAVDALGRSAPERARLRATLVEPGTAPAQDPYVLVRILEIVDAKSWSVQAWLFTSTTDQPQALFENERSYAPTESERLVSDLLSELSSRAVDENQAIVAFLLPRGLLNQEIDRWRPALELSQEPTLGSVYAVTVRPLERTQAARARQYVQRQWNSLKDVAPNPLQFANLESEDAPAPPAAVWITPDVPGGPGLIQRLRRWGITHAVLTGPPGASPGGMAALFDNVLQAGVPVVVWIREPAGLSADDVRDLVKGPPLLDLPHRLRATRGREEERNESGLGSRLALLWDAADYTPPDHDPENRAVSP
jgi:vWA-MoxR associated protein C-terminal domain/SIR2-like domain